MTIEQIKEKLKSAEYDFLRTNENLGSNIILLTLGGSHAYGMDKEDSDKELLDNRKIFLSQSGCKRNFSEQQVRHSVGRRF